MRCAFYSRPVITLCEWSTRPAGDPTVRCILRHDAGRHPASWSLRRGERSCVPLHGQTGLVRWHR